jgi:hypothetical protein
MVETRDFTRCGSTCAQRLQLSKIASIGHIIALTAGRFPFQGAELSPYFILVCRGGKVRSSTARGVRPTWSPTGAKGVSWRTARKRLASRIGLASPALGPGFSNVVHS